MEAPTKFTTSPATSGLLLSLRHLQNAQEALYSALEDIGGEELANRGLAEYCELAKPLCEFVEGQILDNIRYWAGRIKTPAEI